MQHPAAMLPRMSIHKNPISSVLFVTAFLLFMPPTAYPQTSGGPTARLLEILRDRGSITTEEYDELLRTVAPDGAASESAVTLSALEARVNAQAAAPASKPAQTATPAPAPAAQDKATQDAAAEAVRRALAGKWYEKISLRGYTQFRLSEVFDVDGVALEVPADRSVNANESLMIRRGRLVFSGDVSDHLALYAQIDLNGSTGAADFALQMRDLYADIYLDKAKTFRFRLGQSKVPYRVRQHAIEPEPGAARAARRVESGRRGRARSRRLRYVGAREKPPAVSRHSQPGAEGLWRLRCDRVRRVRRPGSEPSRSER